MRSKFTEALIPPGDKLLNDFHVEGLPPIEDAACRILILGTMPGMESLKQQAYYANPRNLFWKLLAEVTGKEVPEHYEDRKIFLIRNKIALWDICSTCLRNGSLDSNISEEMPNDISGFVASHPHLKAIGFNGKTSERLYRKYIPVNDTVTLFSFPSSSPANAGMKWEKKVEEWQKLKVIV